MRKKIIFFLQTLNGGGAERVTINIIKKLNPKIFDISLLLVSQEGVFLDLVPKSVNIYSLNSSKTLFSTGRLRKKIKEIEPDIIYSTLYRTHIAISIALIGIQKEIKTIMRMPNSPKLVIENGELSFINKLLLDLSLQKANLVLAQTPEMKKEIVHYHKIDSSKIEVLINPLDIEFIDNSIKNISNPFDKEYINIIASGRLTHQKGFDILVEAFQQVYNHNNKFRLYIIGKDLEGKLKEYKALADKLKVNDYIKFLGFQKNPYKYYYYGDIFVLSSRWEGLPNTVLENLYLGKKIVATECIPYMRELIEEGRNGFLVEVENPKKLAEAILKANTLSIFSKKNPVDIQAINKVFDI